ncbi:MAG: protein kinase [Planctomycetota bacterium]
MSLEHQEVGGYKILRELGRGSFATVYLALSKGGSRPVALKLLRSAKDEEVVARFDREGDLGRRLKHPGIVPVLAHGRDPRGPFLVLEYQEGGSLADRLSRSELDVDEAVEVVVAVARAVHAAHLEGVIHRDLKPANVLFDGLGNPRVSDFGLAHDAEALETMTRTGDVLGTPFYMSPEQISGAGPMDEQTDVYSLGVILYECLTGRRPYTAELLGELVRQVLAGSPAPLGAGIPPAVRRVCRQAMSADRDERFASAEDFADALELAVLPPPPPPNRLLRAAGLLALGGLALGGVKLYAARQGELPAASPEATPVPASWARIQTLAQGDHALEDVVAELRAVVERAERPLAERTNRALVALLWRRGCLEEAEAQAEVTDPDLARFLGATRAVLRGNQRRAEEVLTSLQLGEGPLARLASVVRSRLAGDYDAAIRASMRLEEGEDRYLHSYVVAERARIEQIRGQVDAAQALLLGELERDPRDMWLRYAEATLLLTQGDLSGGLRELEQILQIAAPREPMFVLELRAQLRLNMGDERGAREDVDRVLAQDSDRWRALFFRGHLAALSQNLHEARDFFRRAISASGDSDQFLGLALDLPEEAGVAALEAAQLTHKIPLLRRQASIQRRAAAVGEEAAFVLGLGGALSGANADAVLRFYDQARAAGANDAALAWEEALFVVGRDEFDRIGAAFERLERSGFDPDRVLLLRGWAASRRSRMDEYVAALETVASEGRGVARSIAFSELASFQEDRAAALRHAERALEEAPDDPLAWSSLLKASAKDEDPKSFEAPLRECLARFGASWLTFLELDAQVRFFERLQDDSRETQRLASEALRQEVEGLAQLSPQSPRMLLQGVDMLLLRPSSSRREIALHWLDVAEKRVFPHQRHEILLTRGWIELSRPKDELDLERVLSCWRKAQEVEPKSQLKAAWYQLFVIRFGEAPLAEFGEGFLPEDRELPPQPPQGGGR